MMPVLFGIIIALLVALALLYNRLVRLRNRYRQAFSQIDIQLKRRYDLIPNLVSTARGYLTHERETLENVLQARSRAISASDAAGRQVGNEAAMRDLGGAETALAGALSRLLLVAERYPELKANTTMARLMEDLTTTENRVAFARQAYNDAVMLFNTACQSFPTSFLGPLLGFQPAEFFVIESPAQKEAPQVSFEQPGSKP